MAALRPAALLAVLALVVPSLPVLAGPVPSDAGSGRDAGPSWTLAVPVASGTFTGDFLVGADTSDWYSFQAAAGDRLKVSVAAPPGAVSGIRLFAPPLVENKLPTPQAQGLFNLGWSPRAVAAVTPASGTHYLMVEQSTGNTHPNPSYQVTLDVGSGGSRAFAAGRGLNYVVVEADVTVGQEVFLYVRQQVDQDVDNAWGSEMTFQYFEGTRPVRSLMFPRGGTLVTQVEVGGVAVDAPGEMVQMQVSPLDIGGYPVMEGLRTGKFRAVVHTTQDDAWIMGAVWTSGTAAVGERHGSGGTVVWSEKNHGAAEATITPLAMDVGARSLQVPMSANFRGIFDPNGYAGTVTDGGGAARPLWYGQFLPLLPGWETPSGGTWTFRLPATHRDGGAPFPYLEGVFVQYPGLF